MTRHDAVPEHAPGPAELQPARGYAILVGSILFVALILRAAGAWGKELWLDELHSALIASRPLSEWALPGQLSGYTPLYFVISLPFSRWGGDFVARLPSVICGVLTVWIGMRLTLREHSRSESLVAGILLALAPTLVVFAGYHRMYALYPLLVLLVHAFHRSERPGAGACYVFACAASMLTFPMAIFYLASFALVDLADRKRFTRAVAGLLGGLAVGLLYSLPGLIALVGDATSDQAAIASQHNVLTPYLFLRFPKFLVGGPFVPLADPRLDALKLPALLVGWLVLVIGMWSRLRDGDRVAGRLVVLTLLPPLLEALLAPFGFKTFLDKSYVPSSIFLMLLAARLASMSSVRIAALFPAVMIPAFVFVNTCWMDPLHPFSMKERRDVMQVPFHRMLERSISDPVTGGLPVVLSDQSYVLGSLRYAPRSSRLRFAPEEMLPFMVYSGPYRDIIRRAMEESGIRFLPTHSLPVPSLWLTTTPPPNAQRVDRPIAGCRGGLYLVESR